MMFKQILAKHLFVHTLKEQHDGGVLVVLMDAVIAVSSGLRLL